MRVTDDEKGWLEKSRQGDPEAFEALVQKYQRMIHSLTYRMTGAPADAEDLAQETFIRAHRQLDSYKGQAKFSSWLYRIAINACLNWRQRESRRGEIHTQWAANNLVEINNRPAAESATNERVQCALLRLPAKQRAAVILTIYEGHNHAEAARALGCSETTVSWRLFAARTKLKRLLKNAQKQEATHE